MKPAFLDVGLCALFMLGGQFASAVETKVPDFKHDIVPILTRCSSCHGIEHQEAGLNLMRRQAALNGGDSGKAIIPGKSSESLLYKLVSGADKDRLMPPPDDGKPLTAGQIETLKQWIDSGADWPASADGSNHWAYQQIQKPVVPAVQDKSWPKSPLDAFVLARLEKESLIPSPETERAAWLRRVSLDLIGLPPTPEQVVEFLADKSNQAYERVVDRLLAAPQYGERWARPWLDLARYADTNGYEKDPRRSIWPWRDWVINALNRDMPFDQFTIEQLAGDLLPEATKDQIVATGFHRNTMINTEGGVDPEEYRNITNVDRVNTTAMVWLGSTMQCAQCHTHKYDPFKQSEYFQLFAFFNSNADSSTGVDNTLTIPTAEQEAALRELKTYEIVSSKSEELKTIRDAIAETRKKITKDQPTTLVMRDLNKPRPTNIQIRGNFMNKGDEVKPGYPASLTTQGAGKPPATRLDLARWLVSRGNPLTARVHVNRLWEQLFGRGIVSTSDDFGTRGAPPSHPEMLDWLANEFIDNGWSQKKLLRTIVLSSTYRQASKISPELLARDPDNTLLARGPRVRLEAEMIRDQALFAAGLLNIKIGGPSVMPPQPEGIWNSPYSGEKWTVSAGDEKYRRGMYTFWKRTSPYPAFMTFDAPSREFCVVRRPKSNTPLQALTTLNDPVYVEAAQALARRVQKEAKDVPSQIQRLYLIALSRPATEAESKRLQELYQSELETFKKQPTEAAKLAGDATKLVDDPKAKPTPEQLQQQAAWTAVCNVVLNLDETLCK
jgi:hypothetical protein